MRTSAEALRQPCETFSKAEKAKVAHELIEQFTRYGINPRTLGPAYLNGAKPTSYPSFLRLGQEYFFFKVSRHLNTEDDGTIVTGIVFDVDRAVHRSAKNAGLSMEKARTKGKKLRLFTQFAEGINGELEFRNGNVCIYDGVEPFPERQNNENTVKRIKNEFKTLFPQEEAQEPVA